MQIGFGNGFGYVRAASGLYVPPSGNVVSNWAGTGTGGTNGLPDGWSGGAPAGVTLSVLSVTPYRGGNIIEVLFSGTATAAGNCLIQPNANSAAVCAPGQTWAMAGFIEPVGTPLPLAMLIRLSWRNNVLGFISTSPGSSIAGTITGAAQVESAVAPASANYVWAHFVQSINLNDVVNLRYKIFAPTLRQTG